MLDEKDLQAIHTMMEQQKKEILKESMANMQVIIENTFAPQFKLLFEKLDSMGSKMIPQEAMDIMEDRVKCGQKNMIRRPIQEEFIGGLG